MPYSSGSRSIFISGPSIVWAPGRLSAVQLFVQFSELLQETGVGWDVSVGADGFNCVHQRHVVVDHEIGQDQSGWAAEAHGAVDKHSS